MLVRWYVQVCKWERDAGGSDSVTALYIYIYILGYAMRHMLGHLVMAGGSV